MKILFILPRYHTNQYFWTKTLKEKGHEVHYLVAEKVPALENYALAEPLIVKHNPLPEWLQKLFKWYMVTFTGKVRDQFLSLPERNDLRQHLLNIKPELVVIREISYPLSFFAYLECKKLGLPVIRYTQYPLELPERWLTRLFEFLKIVPNISITPSRLKRGNRQNLETGAYYVPLITDFLFDGTAKRYAPNGVVRILFVGKFVSLRKNHLLLLDALNQIKNRLNFKLIMVGGDGNADPKYMALIRKHIELYKLTDKVELLSNVPHDEMGKLYAEADLFVLPSANEAFSISPIEAMNYGVPVIITDTNGAKHSVVDGENGYVVKTNDAADLVEKILLAAKDAETLKRMGQNAFAYHQKEHSPEMMYECFMRAAYQAQAD